MTNSVLTRTASSDEFKPPPGKDERGLGSPLKEMNSKGLDAKKMTIDNKPDKTTMSSNGEIVISNDSDPKDTDPKLKTENHITANAEDSSKETPKKLNSSESNLNSEQLSVLKPKTWHVDPKQDIDVRRVIIKDIGQLLDSCKPKAFVGQPQKLLNLARRLEVALYKAAKTREEYMDASTLRTRVVNLVKQSNAAQGKSSMANKNQSSSSVQTNPGESTINEKQKLQILRQRQQRLLLLRHASQCQVPEGEECGITPHCSSMKKLWKHIGKCKDQRCTVPHCVSSRYVLSHFHRCMDNSCSVCKPVRIILQRQAKESGADINLKRRRSNSSNERTGLMDRNKQIRIATGSQTTSNFTNPGSANRRRIINPRFARSCISGTGPSLPLSMKKEAIIAHLQSLKVEKLQACLSPVLRKLMESKHNRGIFNEPVDYVALNIPEYPKIISEPMDLGTVRQKLDDGKYSDFKDFDHDVHLTFANAIKFNPADHPVHQLAQILLKIYEADIPKALSKIQKEVRRRNDKCQLCYQTECEICPLCERGCIAFEPKVIYCSGPCASRIGRNSSYYTIAGVTYNWCTECYDKCKSDSMEVNAKSYKKARMEKKRNNELFAEPWVSCDKCYRWVHQVCALFNSRKNSPHSSSTYTCPECLVKMADKKNGLFIEKSEIEQELVETKSIKSESGESNRTSTKESNIIQGPMKLPLGKHVPDANDLEQTRLGVFMENWVRGRYGEAREELMQNSQQIQGDPGPELSKLHIRVLSNFEDDCKVKPFVKKVLPTYPDAFKFRSRCIFLFQELDGVQVLIYAMFVQEYGSDCADPNKRKLYIAYLDSVHYFRPRKLRTLVYHELLLSYLEYSRRNGYTSAYIWACPPPNKRDDYIIHCHPEEQRVPSADRLRKWYHHMISRGCDQNIIVGSCSLFEEHFESTPRKANKSKAKKGKKMKKKKKMTKKGKKKSTKNLNVRGTSMTPPLEEDDRDDEFNLLDSIPALSSNDSNNVERPDEEKLDNDAETGQQNQAIADGNGLMATDGHNMLENYEKRKENKLALLGNLPYFEGDYWPQEAEELGKEQEAKLRARKTESSRTGRKRQRQEQNKLDGSGTAASPETFPEAKPVELDLKEAKKVLVTRLSEQLEAMKDDFLVVKLAHECARCGKYLLRGRWECRHPDCHPGFVDPGYKPCPFSICNPCYVKECERPKEEQHGGGCVLDGDAGEPKPQEEEKRREEGEDQEAIVWRDSENGSGQKKGDEKSGIVETKESTSDPKKSNPEIMNRSKVEEVKTKSERELDSQEEEVDAKRAKNNEGKPLKNSKTADTLKNEDNSTMGKEEESKKNAAISERKKINGNVTEKMDTEIKKEENDKLEEERKREEDSKKKEKEQKEKERKELMKKKIIEWNKISVVCTRRHSPETSDHKLYYVDENMPVRTPTYDRPNKNLLVETRHAFLSLCTGNRYQFDQLRRAKHSTMMVLYHLHNPDAPAHLFTCNECRNDILAGKRFHCDVCNNGDFDLCEACASGKSHPHQLTPLVVTGGVDTSSPEMKRKKQRITEMRRARKHSLQLFLQALVHASSCDDPDCDKAPCKKMKDLLRHRVKCPVRVRGGCEVCRRVLCLVQMHARHCKLPNCRVPYCDDLKAHLLEQKRNAEKARRGNTVPRLGFRERGIRGRTRGGIGVAEAQTIQATVVAGSGGTRLKIKARPVPTPKVGNRSVKKKA